MCLHYSEYAPSGPRGEPHDTPGGWDCEKEHYECKGEECPDYEYAPRKEDFY